MDKLTLTFIRMDTAHQTKMMNVMWHSLAGRVACVLPRPFDRVRVRVPPPVHSLYLPLPLHQFSGRKTEAAKRDELRGSKAEVHRRLELCPYTFLNFEGKYVIMFKFLSFERYLKNMFLTLLGLVLLLHTFTQALALNLLSD